MNWTELPFERTWISDFFNTPTITHSYGRLYNPETHDIVPRREYVQKEIESLKTSKKQHKEAIVVIDKKIEELEKRLE